MNKAYRIIILVVLLALLQKNAFSQKILDCSRITEDFRWPVNTQYETLNGIKLSNDDIVQYHFADGSGQGKVTNDNFEDTTPIFPLSPSQAYDLQLVPVGTDAKFAAVYILGSKLLMQPFSASGSAIGNPIEVYEATATVPRPFQVIQLQNPSVIAIVWREYFQSGERLLGRTFNNWVPSSAIFTIAEVERLESDVKVFALTSGDFVVAWHEFESTLKLRTFQSNGKPRSENPVLVSRNVVNFNGSPLKNADGNFVIGWASLRDLTNSTGGSYVFGQIFDKDGDSASSPFSIRTSYNETFYNPYSQAFEYTTPRGISFVLFPDGKFIALFIAVKEVLSPFVNVLNARKYLPTGVALDSSEYPLMNNVDLYQSIVLQNGGWLLYAEFVRRPSIDVRGITLKAFSSFYDRIGIESHPINGTDYVTYKGLLNYNPRQIIEITGDSTSSRLILFWAYESTFNFRAYSFGLQCVLRDSECYDDLHATTGEQIENIEKLRDQRYPSISEYPFDSNQVVVWQSSARASGKWDIISRFNDRNEVRVSLFDGTNTNPSVSMTSANSYFAVWQSFNQDGSGWGIYGKILYENYSSDIQEFRINDYTASNQITPSVACSSVNRVRCVVVWQSLNQDGSGYGIYAKLFIDFQPSSEFRVNTQTANNQENPTVAFLPDGIHFVITWQGMTDGDGWGVYYKVSSGFVITSQTPSPVVLPGPDLSANTIIAGNQIQPSVASYLTTNQFVIAWKSQRGSVDIVARLFDIHSPVTDDFVVASVSGTQLGFPSVSSFYIGWAVAWQGTDGISLKVFNGTEEENFLKVSTTSVGTQPARPGIAGNPFNVTITVAWESNQIDGSGYGIGIRSFACEQ